MLWFACSSVRTRSCLLYALLAGLAPALQAKPDCPPRCSPGNDSVVHAAGVPDPELIQAISELSFNGTTLTSTGRVLATLVQRAKALPTGTVVKLDVGADKALAGPTAMSQAATRAKTLTQALLKAGLPANQFTVSAR